MLISAVAWAGNTPEYDVVGRDTGDTQNFPLPDANFIAATNGIYQLVWQHPVRGPLQDDSDFTGGQFGVLRERFETNAGQLKPVPCYGGQAYNAALTDVWNEGTYDWWITLQMKPESDLDLNIYDCVLKHNETDLFRYADQTGRYRQPWGELVFNPLYNPLVYAEAIPGIYATSGFEAPFTLDARTLPGLINVALDGVSYTSKAHWPEGIVAVMPKTGTTNASGQLEYNLKQGDLIHITIEIPSDTNTVDVWYGEDSVLIKYIGIINTEYFASR
ncbi:MAG: hypothetical protein GY850_18840 [bacterium]|nr:hypothetical protein [bacterium]